MTSTSTAVLILKTPKSPSSMFCHPKICFLRKGVPPKITVESPRCFWELKKVSQFVFLFHLSWSPPSNPRKCWLRLSDFGCYSCHASPGGYLHTPMFGCLGIFGIFVPTRDLCVFFYVNLSGCFCLALLDGNQAFKDQGSWSLLGGTTETRGFSPAICEGVKLDLGFSFDLPYTVETGLTMIDIDITICDSCGTPNKKKHHVSTATKKRFLQLRLR